MVWQVFKFKKNSVVLNNTHLSIYAIITDAKCCNKVWTDLYEFFCKKFTNGVGDKVKKISRISRTFKKYANDIFKAIWRLN